MSLNTEGAATTAVNYVTQGINIVTPADEKKEDDKESCCFGCVGFAKNERAKNCVDLCFAIPSFCIAVAALAMGCVVAGIITDPENLYYVNTRPDFGGDGFQGWVMMHPRSLSGDQITVLDISLEVEKASGTVVIEENDLVNVSASWDFELLPSDVNLETLDVVEAPGMCALAIQHNSSVRTPQLNAMYVADPWLGDGWWNEGEFAEQSLLPARSIVTFRNASFAPLAFPSLENSERNYWCQNTSVDTRNVSATEFVGDNRLYGQVCGFPPATIEEQKATFHQIEGTPYGITYGFLVFYLVVWFVVRVIKLVVSTPCFPTFEPAARDQGESEACLNKCCGMCCGFKGTNEEIMQQAFSKMILDVVPTLWIAPFTSLAIHEACPQLATWPLQMLYVVFPIGLIGVVLAPCVICFNLKSAGKDKGKETGGSSVACFIGIAFGVVCVGATGFYAYVVFGDMLANLKWPQFPVDFSELVSFAWPRFTLSWSTDAFRWFAFLIPAIDTYAALGGKQFTLFLASKTLFKGAGAGMPSI